MASTNSADEHRGSEGKQREKWERPALRRLGASLAEANPKNKSDGGGMPNSHVS